MRIGITGGAGYVGTQLSRDLLGGGHEVVVFDTFWFGNTLPHHPALSLVETDIRQLESQDLSGLEAVIHLAGIANDPMADLDPALSWEVATLGTLMVMRAAENAGVGQVIFASSGSVYGVSDAPKVTEVHELRPISLYNKTKMVAERVVQSFESRTRIKIVRPGTVCGLSSRMRLDLAVNAITFAALSKGEITIDGGTQVRPHVHLADLSRAYVHLLSPEVPDGIYNVGFENLTIREIANLVAEETGARIKLGGASDPRTYRLHSDKIEQTGFTPSQSVRSAIREMVSSWPDLQELATPQAFSTTYLASRIGPASA